MGQSRFFGEPLTGDSWHSDENNKFQPGEFNTEFDVVIPAPVSRSNVIFDNFLEEQAEQKQAVEDALGDEIANGDINPTDIDMKLANKSQNIIREVKEIRTAKNIW